MQAHLIPVIELEQVVRDGDIQAFGQSMCNHSKALTIFIDIAEDVMLMPHQWA